MAKSRRNRNISTNKNSRVNVRIDRTGKVRTETARRDNGELDVAISTDERTNSTRVFIDLDGRTRCMPYPSFELNGRQARTLFLALRKHFINTSKDVWY